MKIWDELRDLMTRMSSGLERLLPQRADDQSADAPERTPGPAPEVAQPTFDKPEPYGNAMDSMGEVDQKDIDYPVMEEAALAELPATTDATEADDLSALQAALAQMDPAPRQFDELTAHDYQGFQGLTTLEMHNMPDEEGQGYRHDMLSDILQRHPEFALQGDNQNHNFVPQDLYERSLEQLDFIDEADFDPQIEERAVQERQEYQQRLSNVQQMAEDFVFAEDHPELADILNAPIPGTKGEDDDGELTGLMALHFDEEGRRLPDDAGEAWAMQSLHVQEEADRDLARMDLEEAEGSLAQEADLPATGESLRPELAEPDEEPAVEAFDWPSLLEQEELGESPPNTETHAALPATDEPLRPELAELEETAASDELEQLENVQGQDDLLRRVADGIDRLVDQTQGEPGNESRGGAGQAGWEDEIDVTDDHPRRSRRPGRPNVDWDEG